MTVVGFLQNMWFKDPERAKRLLGIYCAKKEDGGREQFIRDMLFLGCLTGRRLQQAFGERRCGEIVWEEVSPELGGHSGSVFPADLVHIRSVLAKHQPTVVIAFGRVAQDALHGMVEIGQLFRAPHPAARHATVMQELHDVAGELELLQNKEIAS